MDDVGTFNKALQEYKDAYIRINMVRAPPNAIDQPRNAILAQLDRLQKIVNAESAEIANFSSKSRMANAGLEKTAMEARSLRAERTSAGDELTRTTRVMGDTPPTPDWSPMYTRVGIAGGMLIAILGVSMVRR